MVGGMLDAMGSETHFRIALYSTRGAICSAATSLSQRPLRQRSHHLTKGYGKHAVAHSRLGRPNPINLIRRDPAAFCHHIKM
jgi:hypothetical protein